MHAIEKDSGTLQRYEGGHSCPQAGSIADLSDDGEPDEGELCVVCMEHLREIVSFPCGHMVCPI